MYFKDEDISILFLGDRQVGKTSIINQFAYEIFETSTNIICSVEETPKIMGYRDGRTFKVTSIEAPGLEEAKNYLDKTQAIFLVCKSDIDSSINNIEKNWIDKLKNTYNYKGIIVIVMNKADKQNSQLQQQKKDEVSKTAKENEVLYGFINPKDHEGIRNFYSQVIEEIKKKKEEKALKKKSENFACC